MSHPLSAACLALLGMNAAIAAAQLTLPGARLPALPLPGLGNPIAQTLGDASELAQGTASGLRRLNADALMRRNRASIEADPNGAPELRGQLVSIDLDEAARERIEAAGFTLMSQQALSGVQAGVDTWRTPPGVSTQRALAQLRALAPAASHDYDHLYSGSSAQALPPSDAAPAEAAAASAGAVARVGLIDSGVQGQHPALRQTQIVPWGCNGHGVPAAHGTAVASLLVGQSQAFRGALPAAQLFAADVYCGEATGGSIASIAAALAWLSAQPVAVINISLVGPDNLILRQLVQRLTAHGYLIVAAVGNDGPAAAPLYPAAYAGVVGVTAVDAHRHLLLEAERGQQVMFAAPGADMIAATLPDGYGAVRGTSFAAPLVAGLLAARLTLPDVEQAQAAIEWLAQQALDLGPRGRDNSYGFGLVGEQLRMAPSIMQGRGAALR